MPGKLPEKGIRVYLTLPAERIRFALADIVTLWRIRTDAPLDQAFEFIDEEGTRQGDYYFVRVMQLDGGIAWASPVWVGGFSPRHEKASR